jgi:hypothetical protein
MSENKTAIVARESQAGRYAVIEARWNDDSLERFVIAYREGEGSLDKLLAAPSVIETGFSSREAAVAAIANCSSTGAASKTRSGKARFRLAQKRPPRNSASEAAAAIQLMLTEARRIAYATLQHAVAGCILLFYSRNAVGAAIRSLVGAPL